MEIDYLKARGYLKPLEREALYQLAGEIGVSEQKVMVNIGVEYGASLACLRAGNPKATIYGVDVNIKKAVSRYGCKLIEVDSGQLVHEWQDEIDLLFVDGDHSYEGVKRDIEWAKLIREDGLVIFHDCFDWDDPSQVHRICPGVNVAVGEWFESQVDFVELDPVWTMRIFQRIT